jgi:hypothetical protein
MNRIGIGLSVAVGLGVLVTSILGSGCNEILGLHDSKLGKGGSGGMPPACDPVTGESSSTLTSTGSMANFDCVGTVEPRCATDITYFFHFRDNDKAAAGLSVSVCQNDDQACAMPLQSGLSPDASGNLTLTEPSTFDGYLQVDSAMYKPTIVEMGQSTGVSPSDRIVRMVTQSGFSLVLSVYGVMEDPTRGSVAIFALDCNAQSAADVRFAIEGTDSETVPFYFANGIPNKQVMQTDSSGFGGFINVAATTVTLRSFFAGTNNAIGVQSVHVHPGAYTQVFLGPTPLNN